MRDGCGNDGQQNKNRGASSLPEGCASRNLGKKALARGKLETYEGILAKYEDCG